MDERSHAKPSLTPPVSHQTWAVSKPQVESHGGIVAAQHHEAAQIGADVLAAGGNAMDAAVTTALALSVVEPWLSGLGGGGFLLHASADGTVEALDFNLRAPLAADPADFPLVGGAGGDWFNWPSVQDDRNLIGPMSICVPGAVAGLAEALEKHGTLPWADALAPAIGLAERGMRVDWFAELAFAIDAPGLSRDADAAALFLDPRVRTPDPTDPTARLLPMPLKATMLRRLAQNGARDFYEGETAATLVADLQAKGSKLAADDFSRYRPTWNRPASGHYRDRIVHTIPGLSGGPSLLDTLMRLTGQDMAGASDADFAAHHANAIRATYQARLKTMGHAAAGRDCTSHLSVIDRQGNMVSLTNTLLSRFGSKVVAPSLGLTMNNGMMWFDPRPDQPNSIAPGAVPLANMAPVITTRDGTPDIAVGAAGGRQIFPAIVQLLSQIIDHGASPEQALHAPRIDASAPTVLVNRVASPDTASAIAANHPVQITEDSLYPVQFAIPSLVQAGRGGMPNCGAVHPNNPWTKAVSE
ncbi:gamma-glutamyltransferase 1 Threonine peptidase. MEROPS family T03 [Jannaschia faecimaris]|uniref:Gamma-glutamyltransferase 1 Threonine peptidase. MEROPS family T03 n=1 Tax=Jannaschia faecimaris TaxID=1244108 RepID=A0A1H3P6B2_9RHOB|nr:gamma-glutamyltransferase [Jannaschia faecimaris]SDY96611.1 gamma-glutamyltransferase 1 Threonine peptidase. MEROPS family T03 [Jannaschia faecimaris]